MAKYADVLRRLKAKRRQLCDTIKYDDEIKSVAELATVQAAISAYENVIAEDTGKPDRGDSASFGEKPFKDNQQKEQGEGKPESYGLSQKDLAAMQIAHSDAQSPMRAVVSAWEATFAPLPSLPNKTGLERINFITRNILSWGEPSLTLDELQSSINTANLLTKMPSGANEILRCFESYLNATTSVSQIQQSIASSEESANSL